MRLGVVLFASVLVGCQPAPADVRSAPPPAGLSPPVQAEEPPPAAASDDPAFDPTSPVWHVSGFGSLIFSPRNSDDIRIQMSCETNEKVEIWAPNSAEDGERLRLASGSEAETFPATRIPADDEGFEGVASRVQIDPANHVLAAFRRSGQLSQGDGADVMNAKAPAEMQSIESFFADCKASPG